MIYVLPKHLLLETQLTVYEISEQCSWASVNTLYRSSKKVCMGSPNEMRGTTVIHNSNELKAAAKGVKDTNKAGSKSFGFIQFAEHVKDDITNRMKKANVQRKISVEKDAKFLVSPGFSENISAGFWQKNAAGELF